MCLWEEVSPGSSYAAILYGTPKPLFLDAETVFLIKIKNNLSFLKLRKLKHREVKGPGSQRVGGNSRPKFTDFSVLTKRKI